MSATLEGARPMPAVGPDLAERLADAARQAVELGGVIHVDTYALCADTAVIELWANGAPTPRTASLTWPEEGDELDGRSVLVFRT